MSKASRMEKTQKRKEWEQFEKDCEEFAQLETELQALKKREKQILDRLTELYEG